MYAMIPAAISRKKARNLTRIRTLPKFRIHSSRRSPWRLLRDHPFRTAPPQQAQNPGRTPNLDAYSTLFRVAEEGDSAPGWCPVLSEVQPSVAPGWPGKDYREERPPGSKGIAAALKGLLLSKRSRTCRVAGRAPVCTREPHREIRLTEFITGPGRVRLLESYSTVKFAVRQGVLLPAESLACTSIR
jgi:hypothetical protein